MPDLVNKTIFHYRLLEKLGEGGMGVVYKARDTRLNRFVALKFLTPSLTKDADSKKRFMLEAQAASGFDHPNICTIHEINETLDGQLYICMAYYEGQTLKEAITSVGAGFKPTPTPDALHIIIHIAKGLQRAHEEGIIHRDIKPANIIITTRGEVKILDFGLVKLAGQDISKSTITPGTVAYMSPEFIQKSAVDHRTDIWSLGVVIYEMLSGQRPFDGDSELPIMYSIVNEAPKPLSKLPDNFSQEWTQIIDSALQKNPAQRYQSAARLLEDLSLLNALASHSDSQQVFTKTPARATRKFNRRFLIWLSVMLIFAAGYGLFSQFDMGSYFSATSDGNIFTSQEREAIRNARQKEFVIAVAPFWGFDENAAPEAARIQALLEQNLLSELENETLVRIIRLETNQHLRNHEAARKLAQENGADLIIWGDFYNLHGEAEFQAFTTTTHPLTDSWGISVLSPSFSDILQVRHSGSNSIFYRRAKTSELSILALLIAVRYYTVHRNDEQALKILQKIYPPTSLSLAITGDIYARRQDPEANSFYQQALQLDDHNPVIYLSLARLHIDQMQLDIAEMYIQKAISLNLRRTDSYRALGWLYLAQGKTEAAIQKFHTAVELDPESADLRFALGQALTRQSQYLHAISEFEKGIQIDPSYEWSYIGLSQILSNKYLSPYNPQKAVQLLEEAILEKPLNENIYLYLAGLYQSQRESQKALKYVEKSLALNPNNINAFFRLGFIFEQQGKYDEAELLYRRAIQKNEAYRANIDPALAWVYHRQGNLAAADSLLRKLTALAPENSFFRTAYARNLIKLGELNTAIFELKKASKLAPANTYPLLILMQAYFLKEDYEMAIKVYQQTMEVIRGSETTIINTLRHYLGFVYLAQNEPENAAKLYRENLDNQPDDLRSAIFYFLSLQKAGRKAGSRTFLKRYLANARYAFFYTLIANYYRGNVSEDKLLRNSRHKYKFNEYAQKCEAFYHIGMSYLLNTFSTNPPVSSDTLNAKVYFEKCLEIQAPFCAVQVLAKAELRQLNKRSFSNTFPGNPSN